ncbi:HAD family hydrolase [Rhodoferax sp. UBA5149]|uniref:HAD family hydrolase n=1 Tax=Rhodoferax sp. UBA5149 TaxID=1947379 RepID=UPI0025E7B394|nr:HAD family phosphatase [Rhodoferax sp. UBA5149]
MNFVFDFGAVLFTWQPHALLRQHFPQVASSHERAVAMAKDFFHHPDWLAFDRGALPMEAVIARTAERLALPGQAVGALVSNIGELLTPLPDTVAVLDALRARRDSGEAVRLYFLSNMPAPYARELEQRHAFLQWFDGGIFSGDVQHIKPELAIYQLLQTRYALEPTQTLFIDDLQDNVQAACGLGWRGIHFVSAPQLQAHLADLTDR